MRLNSLLYSKHITLCDLSILFWQYTNYFWWCCGVKIPFIRSHHTSLNTIITYRYVPSIAVFLEASRYLSFRYRHRCILFSGSSYMQMLVVNMIRSSMLVATSAIDFRFLLSIGQFCDAAIAWRDGIVAMLNCNTEFCFSLIGVFRGNDINTLRGPCT